MAKFAPPESPPARGRRPDPRAGLVTPVQWHTDSAPGLATLDEALPLADEAPPAPSDLWVKVKRTMLFWRAPRDVLRVSVFGPPAAAPGQPAKLSVYVHTPDAEASVRTLSRAFHHDSELIGTGLLTGEAVRGGELAVHLSVANAGVSRSQVGFVWRGQPHRLVFDLHVPWESPAGPAPGAVSVGRGDARLGRVEFRLTLLPRKG